MVQLMIDHNDDEAEADESREIYDHDAVAAANNDDDVGEHVDEHVDGKAV